MYLYLTVIASNYHRYVKKNLIIAINELSKGIEMVYLCVFHEYPLYTAIAPILSI